MSDLSVLSIMSVMSVLSVLSVPPPHPKDFFPKNVFLCVLVFFGRGGGSSLTVRKGCLPQGESA